MANSLQSLFQAIAIAHDEQELRQHVRVGVREYFAAQRCSLFFFEQLVSAEKKLSNIAQRALSLDRNPVLRYLVERHAAVHDELVLPPGVWKTICPRSDHAHVIAGPIVTNGCLVGGLGFTRDSEALLRSADREAPAFNAQDLADLSALCLHLSTRLATIESRSIPDGANLKQVRIVRRASGWFAMLTLQWNVSIPGIMPHGEALGIDVGISHFAAVSNGKLFPNPRPFRKLERKLKLLQRSVSRKVKGSNNRKKAQFKVSKLHERIANVRKDYHWLLAHNLCNWAGMIFAEDLNLKGLARGFLGKHCLDAGWGQFFQILEQCCFKRGVFFLKVDSNKTSQICPNCLTQTGKKELSERTHSCQHCGYTTDRDVAAAQVVLIRGLAAVGHTVKMLSEGKAVALPVTKESSPL